MAAEMVGSAVAQETVNEVLSRIKEGYAEKSDAKEHIERMEMAHIKLEAALETPTSGTSPARHCCAGRASSSVPHRSATTLCAGAGSDYKKRKKCSKRYRAPPFLRGLLILLCHLFRRSLVVLTTTSSEDPPLSGDSSALQMVRPSS